MDTNKENVRKLRKQRRLRVRNMKVASGCIDCGNKHPAVLDFHHGIPRKDTGEKSISRLISETASWEKVLDAISKCDILCANCHRLRHWEEDNMRP